MFLNVLFLLQPFKSPNIFIFPGKLQKNPLRIHNYELTVHRFLSLTSFFLSFNKLSHYFGYLLYIQGTCFWKMNAQRHFSAQIIAERLTCCFKFPMKLCTPHCPHLYAYIHLHILCTCSIVCFFFCLSVYSFKLLLTAVEEYKK